MVAVIKLITNTILVVFSHHSVNNILKQNPCHQFSLFCALHIVGPHYRVAAKVGL